MKKSLSNSETSDGSEVLVLLNDILALFTLSFVTVATYAVFMQISLLFIVIVRYFFLGKSIYRAQLLSVVLSMAGMTSASQCYKLNVENVVTLFVL